MRETFRSSSTSRTAAASGRPLVAGPITVGDMVTLDPFNNTVVLFEATGARIRQLLTRNAPYPSGLRYRMVDGVVTEVTIGGQPLQDDKIYKGATNSYFAGVALKDLTREGHGPDAARRRDRVHPDAGGPSRRPTTAAAW